MTKLEVIALMLKHGERLADECRLVLQGCRDTDIKDPGGVWARDLEEALSGWEEAKSARFFINEDE